MLCCFNQCCDRDGQASEVNPGGIPACKATKNPVSAQGQGKPEPELISLEEETNLVDIPTPTQLNGSIEDSEEALGSNSASAINMAAVSMVLVGVAIQMAI